MAKAKCANTNKKKSPLARQRGLAASSLSKKKKRLWARVPGSKIPVNKDAKHKQCAKARAASVSMHRQRRSSAAACVRKKVVCTTTTTTTTTTTLSAADAKRKKTTKTSKDTLGAAANSSKKRAAAGASGCCGSSKVYVLELQGGYVYVGKTSRGIATRLAEHMDTSRRFRGAAFTKLHPPTGRMLKRLGNLEGDGDGPERDETLRQMRKHGPQRVRGWKYVRSGLLGAAELQEIETNMREVFDLCRKCGKKGHFTMQCPAKK